MWAGEGATVETVMKPGLSAKACGSVTIRSAAPTESGLLSGSPCLA